MAMKNISTSTCMSALSRCATSIVDIYGETPRLTKAGRCGGDAGPIIVTTSVSSFLAPRNRSINRATIAMKHL